MKYITSLIFFLTASFAFAGIAGFLTKEKVDWKFVQSVGGLRVSLKDSNLVVECDVSGTKQVTVKPTMVNSAMGVRELKHKRDGNTIYLTVVTSVLEKGITTSPQPVDLSAYAAGEYSVQYLDPNGTKHSIGKITVKPSGTR